MKDDEQLVAEALEGRDAAFAELVERYQHRLLRFLVTRSVNRADAEDALQDAFVNAYRYLGSYSPTWRFSTWLYRIAMREAARRPRHRVLPSGNDGNDDGDPLAACIAAGERDNLWLTARALLPADMYAALWLHYAEDLSLRDVGQALDKSLPWVKVNLFRGRRRLRDALAGGSQDETEHEIFG